MDKELIVIHSTVRNKKTNKDEVVFIGAFKTSKMAEEYSKSYGPGTITTIVPFHLPEHFNTFFNQFKYCDHCDKTPWDNEDKCAYLVRQKHIDEWHFFCLLPTQESIPQYMKNESVFQIELIRLNCSRDTFVHNVHQALLNERKKHDNEDNDSSEMKRMMYETNRLTKTNNLLLTAIFVGVVGNLLTALFI